MIVLYVYKVVGQKTANKVFSNLITFDKENQRWTTSYPFITSPAVLQNNYGQAVACMKSLEAKLIKQNQLTEFNEAFKDIVDRGVFKELSSAWSVHLSLVHIRAPH